MRDFIKEGKFIATVGIFFLGLIIGTQADLPSTIKTCSRNLPRPEECIIDAVDKLRPDLSVGDLGENFKTPPLEPMMIENIEMHRGQEFRAIFTNLLVNGPSQFVVEKLKADINNLAFDFNIFLPQLNFTGKYALKIRILLLDIGGKGNVRGTLSRTRAAVKLRGNKVMEDGFERVKFHRLQAKIKIEDQKIFLDNLFNGDPVLGQVGNQVINDNSKLFLSEIIPGLEKSLSKTFLDIANNILKNSTFDEMFPDV
ncbi:uncharacterized protein LOC129789452 [Lutzomyia longipalpis]|uniref:Putative hemolymph juvenile hormone binding protein n=1 Tax=Lutzomyia longipalpis TaxID=7200 RepID=A0A1B0CK75_LUTLO|nr:uncharacterized protein LOC129789452 [Lutzomyia longipalpis]